MEEYVYLIGIIYPYGELNIMGVYTDRRLLIEAYDKLVKEDYRCMDLKYPEKPEIYKIPLNMFLGEIYEWTKFDGKSYFYSDDNIENMSIDEIKKLIK